MVIVAVHEGGGGDLVEVGLAHQAVGRALGLVEHRQQHGDQQRNDGDDHKEFDEGEGEAARTALIRAVRHDSLREEMPRKKRLMGLLAKVKKKITRLDAVVSS